MFKTILALSIALLCGCACINHNSQQRIVHIAEGAQKSNVQIIGMCGKQPYNGGSGTVIRQDPRTKKLIILTAQHVVDDPPSTCKDFHYELYKEKDADGNELYIRLTIKASDTPNDLALLETTKGINQTYPIVRIGDTNPRLGEEILSIGNPHLVDDMVDTINKGIVSHGTIRWKSGDLRMGIDSGIAPGMSGGAVYNMRGELVGVNQAVMGGLDSFGYAARASTISTFLKGQDEF